jgi:hypothetical protein
LYIRWPRKKVCQVLVVLVVVVVEKAAEAVVQMGFGV